jgi:hypothetical protein
MILDFTFFNHVSTRLRYLDAATATIPSFKPDGHDAAYIAQLVTGAAQSLQQFLAKYNANNAAAGVLAEKHQKCHDASVGVYACMKSCFRNDSGASASIRRQPKAGYNAQTTLTRMNALVDVWGTLPNVPATGAPFVSGELTCQAFADMATDLGAKMRAQRVADAQFAKDLRRFTEQNETWDAFVTAALVQGRSVYGEGTPDRAVIDRIPTQLATQLPGQTSISQAESPGNGAVHLVFTAEHATSFKVLHQGPEDEQFAQVADVLKPGEYTATGLPSGAHQYKVVGVNSRGEGPPSEVVTLNVAVATPPEQPQFTLVESPAVGDVHLQFTAEGATTFQVYHKAPGAALFTLVANLAASETGEYSASGLPAGIHEYKLRGLNANGPGPESEVASIEIQAAQAA